MSTSPPSVWYSRFHASLPTIVGNLALIVGMWLSLVHLPSVPSGGLDPSWRMAMGYGAEHDWQFGKEVVFTYGPLGYLLASTNSGGLYLEHILWQFGGNLIIALCVWW